MGLVPLGGGFGKVFHAGAQPINAGIQGYWNAERPFGGPETTLRIAIQLLSRSDPATNALA
jgi:hypothetical protein